ncbi:MAG: OmpA family protein, partial [Polyangiales bacterium]
LQPANPPSDDDARLVLAGLEITFNDQRPPPPPPVAAAKAVVAAQLPDRDQDGVDDAADDCPDEPEDRDGFADDDGCPDPDNDNDGVLDINDKCPSEPETQNGIDDADGCPDLVRVAANEIVTMKPIRFETNKTTIHRDSEDTLLEVVGVMRSHPEITQVAIEGHTDSVGNPTANMKLSTGRAAAVRTFIINAGIAPERLTSEGFGDTQPIADNATPEGRTQNRRVQFNIVAVAK